MASTSIEARPLDAIEELELVKGYVAVAGKPGVRAAMHKPAMAVEFALDSRPDEWNDNVIARGGANVYVFHDNDLSICPASAGHFFVFQNCCYRGSPVHDLARASIVGQRSLKQLPERPRAGDNLGLGPPPVLELSK
jgi:hypothetical protein